MLQCHLLLQALLALIMFPSLINTSTTEEFSENLKTFLTSTLAGSAIHVILDSQSAPVEESLNRIVMTYEESKTSYVSFLVTTYTDLYEEDLDNPRVLKNITDVLPVFRLFPMSYIHLYFIQNWFDMYKSVAFPFKIFRMYNADPQYIIFWSLYHPSLMQQITNLDSGIALRHFLSSVHGFQILVRRQLKSGKYDIEMICIICHLFPMRRPEIFGELKSPSLHSIITTWKQMHRSHNGLQITLNGTTRNRNSARLVTQRELLNTFIFQTNATKGREHVVSDVGSIFYNPLITSNIKHTFFTYKLSRYYIVRYRNSHVVSYIHDCSQRKYVLAVGEHYSSRFRQMYGHLSV